MTTSPSPPHQGLRQSSASLTARKSRQTPTTVGEADANLDKPGRRYRNKRKGAAAVEFAVVAPIFFLLVFGMIEYGRMVMVQQVITNASREETRRAVFDGATATEVQTVVNSYLQGGSISGGTVTIDPSAPETAVYGDPVSVTVSIDFSQVSWLPSPMFLSGKQLTATSVMRREAGC